MRRHIKYIPVLALLLGTQAVNAQLSVSNSSPNNSPQHLIQNVFMGGTITAFNFEFNGSTAATISSNQVGYFNGGGSIFGIDSGIVMSTGNITAIPNNGFASTMYSGVGDADVLAVAQSVGWGTPPSIMRDRAILEFDFIAPQSDSVAFEYVFASEEWPTYPCSSFNDAFGFFISGPGISGLYSNSAVNVSIVPGTTSLPVAITSIHLGNGWSGSACQYASYPQFYNNGPTSQAFTFAEQNSNNYEGAFTDVFQTAPVFVNACDTYHVKLGICDGTDWVFDSAVFLKAKSFNFTGITVNPAPSYNPFGYDTALYEGCGDLELFFTRTDSTYAPYTLTYSIAGTATMGADYGYNNGNNIPGCAPNGNGGYDCEITFPQDSASVGLNIEIYHDNINEVYESFIFMVTDSNVTTCVGGDTLVMNIIDQPDLQISTFGNTTLDCNSSPALIGVEVTNGLPPYTFSWSNNSSITDSSQTVQPSVTSAYVVQVTDACGYQTEAGNIVVSVFNVPWSAAKVGDNQTISCIDDPATLSVDIQFNDGIWHGDLSYIWSTGSTDSTINVFSTVDTTYSVTITRNCTGESVVKQFRLNVYNDPVVTHTEDIPVSAIQCPGDAVNIDVDVTGGYPPYSYLWSDGTSGQFTVVAPMATETFSVTVTDVCGLVEYPAKVTVNVPVPDSLEIHGIVNDTVPCENLKVHFGPAVPRGGFGWGYTFSWDDFATESDHMQQIIYENTPFTIKLKDGCGIETASKTVWGIITDKTDLALELNEDTMICEGDQIVLKAQGIAGGGDYLYFWEGSEHATGNSYRVSPVQTTTYTVRMTDKCDTARVAKVTVGVSSVTSDFEYEYINDYDVVFTNKTWSSDTLKTYQWKVEGTSLTSNEASPTLPLPDGKAYNVSLESGNEYGCTDVATVLVEPEYHLYIPSGFTPGTRDHINPTWSISSLGIKELKLEVYTRWGDKVFTTTDKHFEWDGTVDGQPLPAGGYTWRIVLLTDHDELVERKGTVNIIR